MNNLSTQRPRSACLLVLRPRGKLVLRGVFTIDKRKVCLLYVWYVLYACTGFSILVRLGGHFVLYVFAFFAE